MNLDGLMNNWIVIAVILPVLIGFFKSEIGGFLTSWNIYRLRAFDLDGRPDTEDKVELLNGATGAWSIAIIEKYVFCLSPMRRGVYLRYPDGGREKVSFLLWASFRKRTPPKGA
ncbi:MAG: hypothetical protein QM498_05410 [Desulfobacterium sp.]